MNKQIEVMKLAASVLRGSQEYKRGHATFVEAVEDIESALVDMPELSFALQPDPAATIHPELYRQAWNAKHPDMAVVKKQNPLTDEQIDLFINGRGDEGDDDYVEPTGDGFGLTDADLVKLVRRVEAAHGIKP